MVLACHHRGQYLVFDVLEKFIDFNINAEFHVVRQGQNWVLNPSDYVHRDLFWLGSKDLWEMYHIKKIVKKEDVIFDIGSNFGYYSVRIATSLKKKCSIYAFEPCLSTYERLLTHIRLNNLRNCIHASRIALSDQIDGEGVLCTRSDNSGATYIKKEVTGNDCSLTSLDHFVLINNIPTVNFMKIDVEGFEMHVLRGGIKIIKEKKPIILIELNPVCLERCGVKVDDLLNLLSTFGYKFFVANRKKLKTLSEIPTGRDHINAFAFPEESLMNDESLLKYDR